jgi:hypothetical protein
MAALTLDRVLAEAEALPADEQEMLESLRRGVVEGSVPSIVALLDDKDRRRGVGS